MKSSDIMSTKMPDIFTASDQTAKPVNHSANQPVDQPSPKQSLDQSSPSVKKERIKHKYYPSSDTDGHRYIDDYSELMRLEVPNSNPLSAFLAKPFRVGFNTQASNETVVLLLRQHPVTQIGWFLLAIILAFAPILFDSISFFGFFPMRYQMAIYFGWYLALLGFIFESFLKWFYNVYIITDERIIDIDFYSLTHRNISAAKIDNIEDTTASTVGFLSTVFDFGTVTIQTAAEKREFEFDGVPHPAKVTTLINDLILEEEREKIEGKVN